MIRFLLDEHVNPVIQRQLLRLDARIEVLSVGDAGAPPNGTPDSELLIWLEENGYVLVTENRSTMPRHFADHITGGRHVPGVLCVRPNVTVGRIIEELYLMWHASVADEYRDRIAFIPF